MLKSQTITCLIIIFSSFGFLATTSALAQMRTQSITAQSDNPTKTASLGTGYQSEKELFVGTCVSGDVEEGGKQNSSFSFQQSLSLKEASAELGLGAGGRARFGAVEVSASARFLQNATSNNYSISSVWLSDYYSPVKRLKFKELSAVGKSVADNDERWAQTCGDEFIAEVERGAKLFFSIRIDFTSQERREQFEAQFHVSGPLASAEGDLKKATREFSRDATVTVSGFQIGGDHSKVTAVFGDSDAGRKGFVQCTLGNFDSCATVIENVIKYASDTSAGFPSQITNSAVPGPAELSYRRQSYASVGKFPKNYPGLDDAIKESRKRLHDRFEEQYNLMILASRLLAIPMPDDKKAPVRIESSKVDNNIGAILSASNVCYNSPRECPRSVKDLVILPIDMGAFTLPPLASIDFRLHTSLLGVLSREDSIKRAVASYKKPMPSAECILGAEALGKKASEDCPPSRPHFYICGGEVGTTESLDGVRTELSSIDPDGSVSIVARVQGDGIISATPYFEGKPIGAPILLNEENRKTSGKVAKDYAFVVLRTTRQNPGWLDINLDASREKLWSGDIPNGDGVFSIAIEDAFGRQTKADIEYGKWTSYSEAVCDNKKTHSVKKYIFRNRLWNSEGPSLKNPGPVSEFGIIEIQSFK